MRVVFKNLKREELTELMALTREYGISRVVMSDEEPGGTDFQAIFSDFSSLLDAIELSLGNDDYERAEKLVRSRFDIAEAHGLTVEFTGLPVSGRIN